MPAGTPDDLITASEPRAPTARRTALGRAASKRLLAETGDHPVRQRAQRSQPARGASQASGSGKINATPSDLLSGIFIVNSVSEQGPDPFVNIDQALVQSVSNAIARRQATVRQGETPYRPILRFQVHPDALRTYYHVYPLFENLRLPMTRENLDS